MKRTFTLLGLLIYTLYTYGQDTVKTTPVKIPNDIQEVVVTGQHVPQSLRNSVYQVKVISNETIRLHAPTNIQQVLNTELGFRFSNDLVLGTADVQLMGMSGRNVKILLDGVPMVDRSDTRESLNQIDVNTVDHIEIVEGPMSVSYGSDALAGVINIITKNPGKSSLSIIAKLQEESVGDEYAAIDGKGTHQQHLGVSWQNKGFSAMGGVTRNNFGGWKIGSPTATVLPTDQWLPKDQWLANAKVGYSNKNFNAWYRIDGLQETLDSKGAMNINNYRAKFAKYITDRYTHQIQSEWRVNSKIQLTGILGYTTLQRATKTVVHDFTTNTEELTTAAGEQDVAKFNSSIFRASLQYKINDRISFQPGVEVNMDNASGARIKGKPDINDYAFFASAEFKITHGINIRPGFRVIKNTVYDAPPVIPSINAKFTISKDLDLRLGYANGFRSPALRELYYDFFDASHSITGNPALKAEQSHSFTGSLVWNAPTDKGLKWRSTLGGFFNHFINRIDYGQSATDASITTLINIGRYKTTGVTLENTLIWKNLNATLGFSYTGRYNNLVEDELQFGNLPQFVWSPELNTNLVYRFPKIAADISVFYKFNGSRPVYELYTAAGGAQAARLAKTGSYDLADLLFNKLLFKNINLNAGVKNLFNVTSITNSSEATGGAHSSGGAAVPLSYGRSYVLGLTFNWTKI